MGDDASSDFFRQMREQEQELRNAIGKSIGSLLSASATNIPDDFPSAERIAREVALGADKHIAMNLDPVRVDEYPALELLRVYGREIPRGEKRVKGVVVPDPDNSWDARWTAACEEARDEAAMEVFNTTGRMVALRNSGVWQNLGDGVGTKGDGPDGKYTDTLGNDFAPFAFDSGMDTDEVSREDTVALGLMGDTDAAEPAIISSPEQIAERLAAKMRQYLTKLRDEEQQRRSDPITFGTSDDLVELAEEKIDSAEELTPALVQEVKFLVLKAIEKGISDDDESLANIYEAIGEPEKANVCRQRGQMLQQGAASRHAAEILDRGNSYTLIQAAESLLASSKELTPEISKQLLGLVEKAFERGVDEKYNLRTKAHAILVTVYEQMHEPEKAENNRQQYIESANGFWLLGDAKDQLAALGKEVTLEAGARILDLLTKAVQKIPNNSPNYHAEAYRTTAEVLEAIGDVAHAVEYYEYALQKNPKIPVKRRLNVLKKNVQEDARAA